MKKIIILVVLLLIVGAGGYYLNSFIDSTPEATQTPSYNDDSLGITFEASDGYVVMEQDANGGNPNLINTIILMQREDYDSVQRGERAGGEGPPVITLQAFRNPEKLPERAWAEKNPSFSNFPLLMGEISPTSVAGKPGITYEADGLYASRNVIFASGEKIYFVSGGYLDRDSQLYRDFDTFIKSIKLQ